MAIALPGRLMVGFQPFTTPYPSRGYAPPMVRSPRQFNALQATRRVTATSEARLNRPAATRCLKMTHQM